MGIYIQKYAYRKPLRSLGVRGCNLVSKDKPVQLDMFTDHDKRDRLEKLEESIDDLRRRFGYRILQRGIIYEDWKLTGINPKDDHTIHPLNYFDGTIVTDYTLKRSRLKVYPMSSANLKSGKVCVILIAIWLWFTNF